MLNRLGSLEELANAVLLLASEEASYIASLPSTSMVVAPTACEGPAMLMLGYSPGACSMAPHIALAEVGVDFELRLVSLPKDEQQSPAHIGINPRGKVPTPTALIDAQFRPEISILVTPALMTWCATWTGRQRALCTASLSRAMRL